MAQQNLKQRIHSGETVVGLQIPISTEPERVKGILDQHTYDFIHVDGQHSPFDEKELFAFCEGVDELGVPVLLRIEHTRNAYLTGFIIFSIDRDVYLSLPEEVKPLYRHFVG